METLRLLFLLCLAVFGAYGVDRNNFKSCDQSGFCKRLRSFKPERSSYVLNLDTVIVHGNVLSAEVQTVSVEDEKKTVVWKYALKLSALVDGTFRVEIDEAEPIYPRYRTQLALEGEPQADGLKLISSTDGLITVANTQGHKAVITVDPLQIDFLDTSGDVAVSLNKRSQLVVEPLRVRGEKVGEEGEGEGEDNAADDAALSENFKGHHDSKPRGNEAISLDFSFPDAENLYGIPEHTDRFHLKTTLGEDPYRLYNLDVFEYEIDSTMAIYGAVPVLYAHGTKRTAGVFWHNSAETWVDVDTQRGGTVVASIVSLVTGSGSEAKDKYARFMSESGVVDVFVLLGPSPSDTFRQYTKLTGVAPIPPKFSLAYHQSRWNYVDSDDVRQLDERFDAGDLPVDVYWLDIEYTDQKKYFTWDPVKFPQPAAMVANVTAKGRKMVVIVDPHIKREAGYFVHEDMTERGHYVKNKDGNDYEGWCWPGSSSYPDFFNPAVSKYYSERYLFENFPGTSKDVHIWNDMNEPSVFNGPEITMPKDCRHYREQDGREGLASYWEHRHVHNEYGLWNIRATHEGMLARAAGKYRPFILTRSAFAGTQRFAAVWTGDNAAEWAHLAASVPMCLSLAAAGVSFCGADVGGFFKNPGAELMTRWYQAGAYLPFFRGHSHIDTKRREPWTYEPATAANIRDSLRRRYALIDFWYTLFHQHSLDGLPVLRAVWQQYPAEQEAYTIDNQFLLGSHLLVRPVVEEGARAVQVYLPGGERALWYDADSYQARPGRGWLALDVGIAKIPVFQRGGSVLPRKERVRRSSALMADDPYTFVVALDADGAARGSLYIDDGETYEYKNNKYIYANIEVTKEGITYSFPTDKAHYATRSWVERIVIAGIQKPPKSAKLHRGDQVTPLQMTLHKGNNVLVIRKPGASASEQWRISFNY